MKFFIPGAKDDKEAAEIYEATKKFAAQTCWEVTDRRIQSMSFRDKGKLIRVEVGKIEPIEGETVVAILESRAYLICTPNRGVWKGQPILVGKHEVDSIVDFDKDDQQEFEKQAAKLLANIDTDVHYADANKGGLTTFCGKPIPPAKTSPYEKDVTCQACIGQSNWRAIPPRPVPR